jgi:hypothetical protein
VARRVQSREQMARTTLETTSHEEPLSGQISDALHHAQELIRAELALAGEELKRELAAAKKAGIALALAALLANTAVLLAAIALVLALGASAAVAAAVGAGLFVLAAAAVVAALSLLKIPRLRRTRSRIARDASVLLQAAEKPAL